MLMIGEENFLKLSVVLTNAMSQLMEKKLTTLMLKIFPLLLSLFKNIIKKEYQK
jgi:hypothetical protein